MGSTPSQGIEIPMAVIGVAALLSFDAAVIASVLSAWIPVRHASRLPIRNVVLGVAEGTQVLSRFIIGIGTVLFLISGILPKVVAGNVLYITGGFSLLRLITATMFVAAGPRISMLLELGFMMFLSAGAMGVLVTLIGFVAPIAESKRMKLVEEIKLEQPEDLKVRLVTSNIAVEGKNIVKDFKIEETTTRVLRGISLEALKGEFAPIMGQSGSGGKKLRDYRKQFDSILGAVGLSGRGEHTPRELSGGQQQRTVIAHALISDPKVLFANESTGNLDSKAGAEIMKLLQSINKNNGQTIIMVTHPLETTKNSNCTVTVKDGMVEQLYMI